MPCTGNTKCRPGPVNTNWGDNMLGYANSGPELIIKILGQTGITNFWLEVVNTNWGSGPVNTNWGSGAKQGLGARRYKDPQKYISKTLNILLNILHIFLN